MNNLKYLRLKNHLSLRQLDKMCGITNSVLSCLENGKRMFRLSHIDTLTDFFKVSSDFLLGKSDYGIIVELKNSFAVISKSDYEKYLEKDMLKEYVEFNSVWRIPSDELEQILEKDSESATKKELLSEIDMLSEEQLKKVLKFIKEILV